MGKKLNLELVPSCPVLFFVIIISKIRIRIKNIILITKTQQELLLHLETEWS